MPANIMEMLLMGLRIGVAIAGAFFVWLLAGPTLWGLAKATTGKAMPSGRAALIRLAAGLTTGAGLYVFLSFGGGSGWQFGLGKGNGPSDGTGDGNGNGGSVVVDKGTSKKRKVGETAVPSAQEAKEKGILVIELIPSKLYKKDKKFYLIERAQPPRDLDEVDDFVKKNPGKFKSGLILWGNQTVTDDSDIFQGLQSLLRDNTLPTLSERMAQ